MDPPEKLKNFGIEVLHFIAIEKERQSMCVAMLCNSGKGKHHKHIDLVVISDPFRVSEGILVNDSNARMVHQSMIDGLSEFKGRVAYLTNMGLDLMDIGRSQKSYIFDRPGETFYRLGFGEKFRLPLFCVGLNDIKDDLKDLSSILGTDTTIFSNLLEKSSFPDILKLPGQYTAIIPDDGTLRKTFGNSMPKKQLLDRFILGSLISGLGMINPEEKTGDSRLNMIGTPILFNKGVPMIGSRPVKITRKSKYSNGIGMIFQTDASLTSLNSEGELIDWDKVKMTYQRLLEKYATLLSTDDIRHSVKSLAEVFDAMVRKEMESFSKNLQILEAWARKISKETGSLDMKTSGEAMAISVSMLPFFKQVRDQ